MAGAQVIGSKGRLGLTGVTVRLASSELRNISCGALAVSGGWNPNVHLTCHQRGRPTWNMDLAAFVPGDALPMGMSVVGAALGEVFTHGALKIGADAAKSAVEDLGVKAKAGTLPEAEDIPVSMAPFWYVVGNGRAWLDLQNDVTTLGKIDVQGAGAAEFSNKIYANAFAKFPVGKVRYGLTLREDGIAAGDGTAARLDEDHFVVTTTTANAVTVCRNMEFARQCLWSDLDVQMISTTEAWAQYVVAGPNARALLQKVVDSEFDISNEAFPFMACGVITVCGGTHAHLLRISFSGELAYEIAVPTRYGDGMIRALMAAGEEFGVVPYGKEALGVMRIDKGHAAGKELNGTTIALEPNLKLVD